MKKILVISPIALEGKNSGNQQDIKQRLSIFEELGYNPEFIIAKNYNWEEVIKIIKEKNIEIIWLEYFKLFKLAQKIKEKWPEKKIYFRAHNYELGHNLEKDLNFIKQGNWILGIRNTALNLIKISYVEKKVFSLADKIFCISLLDLEKYKQKFSDNKLIYLPFYNDYKVQHQPKEAEILKAFYLASNLKNNVNLEGLLNLNSWVKENIKNIKFYVSGSNLDPKIKLNKNIQYLGFVDNLDDLLKDMDLAVIPVKIGYGMKIKAYESLKRGFPTILTNRVSQVIGGKNNQTYIIANNNKELANALKALSNLKTRQQISNQALEFMSKDYSKQKIKEIILSNI